MVGFALALLVIAAGCARTPYQLKRDAQARQVEQLRPAELAHDASAWRAVRALRVRLYASGTGDLAVARAEFEERLRRASQVLESALRARLVLQDVRALPEPIARASDLDAALNALEQLDAGQDVEVVAAVIDASPVVTLSFHELGRARVLGRHMVLRTMDDVSELRALETFDTLDEDERSRLYQQRKRHKETTVLLHELGHVLGALHTRDQLELMHPAHDNEMSGYAAGNVRLMSQVVAARLADPTRQNERELYRQLVAELERSEEAGWVEEERRFAIAELRRVAEAGGQPGTSPPNTPAAAASAPTPAGAAALPEADLGALSEADRARFRALDQQTAQEQWREAFTSASELAASYPDSLPVQQKACEIGMRLGVARKQLKPLCDRMLQLSGAGAR